MEKKMADKVEGELQERLHSAFPFREIFFLSLASQSNIYSCVKLEACASGLEKLLVGSLRGKVSCIDSDSSYGGYKPNSKEVYFTYIPGDAEIISMDAFSRTRTEENVAKNDSMVVAISLVLVKTVNGVKKYQHFLNVYTAMEPEEDHKLEDIARSCQHIELSFTPYQLTHANINTTGEGSQTVFLLSGSDKKMHMFREDKVLQRFEEYSCEEFFPEFKDLPSSVTWLDIKEIHDRRRITAFGCQNGFVGLTIVDSDSGILKNLSTNVEGPVSSVRLFKLKTDQSFAQVSFIEDEHDCRTSAQDNDELYGKSSNSKEENPRCRDVCLLVTSAMELSVVYLDVFKRGLSSMAILPRSDNFDCVTCSMIADFDCDGDNEILLGTYGQELLVYKSYPSSPENGTVHFDLQWTRTFPKPLFSVEMVDFLNDGMKELVVVSLTGVHILQFNVDVAADQIVEKIDMNFDKFLEIISEASENTAVETVG